MTRTINAPGIEYNEIDRSQYNLKQDNSIVGTTSFICGFADKGENYTTQWINSIQTLQETYGVPTNEPEKYFYNAGVEILNKGGIVLMSKLPYDNESKDKFTFVDYNVFDDLKDFNITRYLEGKYNTINDLKETVNNVLYALNLTDKYGSITIIDDIRKIVDDLIQNYTPELQSLTNDETITIEDVKNSISSLIQNINISGDYSVLQLLDSNLCSFIHIDPITPHNKTAMIDLDKLDEFNIGNKTSIGKNKIRIIDITRSQYNVVETNCVSTTIPDLSIDNFKSNDCLGLIPIIITPINAMFFQNYGNSIISSAQITSFNVISSLSSLPYVNYSNDGTKVNVDFESLKTKYSIPLNSDNILDETLSKIAIQLFPQILYMNDGHFDSLHLKDIGIALFRAYSDPSNKNYVMFQLVESFYGSLDQNAKDPITKNSRFIENVVNTTSQYIRLYSTVNQYLVKNCSTVGIFNQQSTSLGFYKAQCRKKINTVNSIYQPLDKILNRNSDRNRIQMDIVVDAGVSTLAQLTSDKHGTIEFTVNSYIKDHNWKYSNTTSVWKSILSKFDSFCKSTRKDCIFIADSLRTFCIEGDSKLIRSTNLKNTIDNTIIPKLRTMTCLNSSYSVGYCDWFYAIDNYSNDLFWIPPSIKAAGIYTYTDAYFHPWDAPAGMSRGVINNVVDCAFSPNIDEAGKIYSQCWNYAINYPLDGIVMEGQKTMQIQQTAFDRINVRRLFLYIEKQVVRYAKFFLYEGNTAYLRQRFVDMIRPVFEDAVNGNGIIQYLIKCDDENNTPQTIDNNELHCSIIVKPVKTIEFIVLDFVCTNQSAVITESILSQ